MIPKLKAGDIILSRSETWLSKQIRKAGKRLTGDCRVSHAALALGSLTERPEAIESLVKVTRSPLSKYEGQTIVIYRRKGLSLKKRNEIALKCVSVEQQGYGWLKIPLFWMDSVFKTYKFTQTFGLSHYKVCSNLVAWAYEKVLGEEVFGQPWRCVSPDTIDDYCINSSKWECILDTDAIG